MTRILVADPDQAFRKALILLLSHKLGIQEICEVGDVGSLIKSLVDHPPDILFLNWSLYGTPGLETCQLLRKSHPELKIILLSVNPEDAAEANAAGAIFLRKGAPAEEIVACVKTLANGKSSEATK